MFHKPLGGTQEFSKKKKQQESCLSASTLLRHLKMVIKIQSVTTLSIRFSKIYFVVCSIYVGTHSSFQFFLIHIQVKEK